MSRRERFTLYKKEQACLKYINGNRSRSEIHNCLHISTRTIQYWTAIYRKYGVLGFTKKTKNRFYSKKFKIELVEKCISGEASSIDLSYQYDISSRHLTKLLKKIPQPSLYFTAIEGFNIPIRIFKKAKRY